MGFLKWGQEVEDGRKIENKGGADKKRRKQKKKDGIVQSESKFEMKVVYVSKIRLKL